MNVCFKTNASDKNTNIKHDKEQNVCINSWKRETKNKKILQGNYKNNSFYKKKHAERNAFRSSVARSMSPRSRRKLEELEASNELEVDCFSED